ncbi:MAG: hypothetical protein Q4E65_07710 [Clostridia bacterium]|nr:hypothetical protein [Clostridia bacterium]
MLLPRMKATPRKQLSLTAFGGYRHDHLAGADQFFDMQNLSSDRFPLLGTRKPRGLCATLQHPNGLCAKNALCYVDGTTLYYDGTAVGAVSNTPKQFVTLGSSILIWPDKLRYDTAQGALTPLGASFKSTGSVTFSMCNLQGEVYSGYTVAAMPPDNPDGGDLWLDTQDMPHTLKRYSAATGLWISVSATYIRIGCTGIGARFSDYDGVRISGCTSAALNTSALLYAVSANYVLIAGTLDAAFSQTTPLTIAREIPDFDYLCEKDNRVWGCSNARREIACCKLGDPTNWACYMGISTDSYAVSVGSGGDFTACCAYNGNVLFFKEDRLLKLLGTKPENFQLNAALCYGVQQGSHQSLATAGGLLFYQSGCGVCAYGGALPELAGAPLGGRFRNAVGGGWDDKYYVSMQDDAGGWHLFAYDTRYGIWHREDDAHALAFAPLSGDLYMLLANGKLLSLSGSGTAEDTLSWKAETGELIDSAHARPQKLILRLEMALGASLCVQLSYDGDDFLDAAYVSVTRKRPVVLPLRLRRCDSLRLRLSGTGEATLHALTLQLEEGSV